MEQSIKYSVMKSVRLQKHLLILLISAKSKIDSGIHAKTQLFSTVYASQNISKTFKNCISSVRNFSFPFQILFLVAYFAFFLLVLKFGYYAGFKWVKYREDKKNAQESFCDTIDLSNLAR